MSLVIEIGRLRQKPERLRGKEPAASLELEAGELAKPRKYLNYDMVVQRVSDELLVQGKLEINFSFICARCGAGFKKTIAVPDFCRTFRLDSKHALINLTPDVREDILLALPMVAVCSDKCKGICGACGANLNLGNCKCPHRDEVNAWRALDDLRLK